MKKYLLIILILVFVFGCGQTSATKDSTVILKNISLSVNMRGGYAAVISVDNTGKVNARDIDPGPNPFLHMNKATLTPEQKAAFFNAARKLLDVDRGTDTTNHRSNLVVIFIETNKGAFSYKRDVNVPYPSEELRTLESLFRGINKWSTVYWP